MLWIWLLTRHAHRWSTGFLDRYFTFTCMLCASSMHAMVRTNGHGTGRSPMEAEQRARGAADAQAHRATLAAGCPHCGAVSPILVGAVERTAKIAARRKAGSVPVAALVTLVALGLFAGPVIADLKYSAALAVVALGVAAAAGAAMFLIVSTPPAMPLVHPAGVWFSRDPSHGPSSWFPAQPGPIPVVQGPNPVLRKFSIVTLGVSALVAGAAGILWRETFRDVYVLNANADKGTLSVRIDGADIGVVGRTKSADIPYEKFEVRSNAVHHVIVKGSDGSESAYDLDAHSSRHGWVLAPHARDRTLCIASVTWYYGTEPKDDSDDQILNAKGPGDRIDLPKSFDYLFTDPPKTIETKQSSETRSTLRAFDCASLARNQMVPFSNVRDHEPGDAL